MKKVLKSDSSSFAIREEIIYDALDMQEFAEFCSNGGWVYFPQNSKWWESYFSQEGTKTTAQLLQDWKIWKEEQK